LIAGSAKQAGNSESQAKAADKETKEADINNDPTADKEDKPAADKPVADKPVDNKPDSPSQLQSAPVNDAEPKETDKSDKADMADKPQAGADASGTPNEADQA
jgi:hypothetical protein